MSIHRPNHPEPRRVVGGEDRHPGDVVCEVQTEGVAKVVKVERMDTVPGSEKRKKTKWLQMGRSSADSRGKSASVSE